MFRWIPGNAAYDPDGPWTTPGRFGDGTFKTIYFADTDSAAVAEFLRRNPELMDFQDSLTIRLYSLDLDAAGECVDVRTDAHAHGVGIPLDRLQSSDADESVRYRECRELARDAHGRGRAGIAYRSAATVWDAWNLVLFGDQGVDWRCDEWRLVPRPSLDPGEVHILT